MKLKILACCVCCIALLSSPGHAEAVANPAPAGRFSCGGQVEQKVWRLWDEQMREFIEQRLLQERLLGEGDVYALYDLQTYVQNLVAMARRCGRMARLREFAGLVRTAYGALEPGAPASPGRRWVCRGGGTCNEKNGLLNQEVMLDSLQFLGLASSLANAIGSSKAGLDEEDKAFINDTIAIVIEHLERWADDAALKRLRKAAGATPKDMRDGASALLFVDADLWLSTIYAELAGLLRWQARANDGAAEEGANARLNEHLRALLQLFLARTSLQAADDRGRKSVTADIDRGYWRFYKDNRYAGYERQERPVVCASRNGRAKPRVRVPERVPQDIGWDISHARRLVPALDALERNRTALKSVFALDEEELPSTDLPKAFANALVAVVWNGDAERPLFSNYWSGANGWFRVAYNNGTGSCMEGYGPYGMTDAFATGGYATWARYRPVIGELGRRLYGLMDSPEAGDARFLASYYPALGVSASGHSRSLARLMFLPSLVQAR